MTPQDNNQLFKEIGELRGDFNGMRASMDSVQRTLAELHKMVHDDKQKYFEAVEAKEVISRLNKLEQWRWWLMGGFSVVAVLANMISDKLKSIIGL